MENRDNIIPKLIQGGALLSAFLMVVIPVFAYDQQNTHPALTDEIVDFYNLNFPDKKINKEEKQWLTQGAIDEDSGVRMLYHFYDPVYNRGLALVAGASSKDWGLSANFQANVLGRQYAGFTSVFNKDSEADFSYGRALEDYTKGDRKRAFYAFGHILHLLEDAGVPDHTRNDPHPPWLDFGSPYEHEMTKWNSKNFNISRGLFLKKEKLVSLNSIESYFDKVANYSNVNFFSKDTITNKVYPKPSINNLKRTNFNGVKKLFIVNKDKNNLEFPIAFIQEKNNKISASIHSKELGSYILDGYWQRLSKEVVINGAGALKLFLDEAEKVKQQYLAKEKHKKPSFWAQLLGVFGVGRSSDDELVKELTTPGLDETLGTNNIELSTLSTRSASKQQVTESGDNGDTSGDSLVPQTLSPLSPTVSPEVSPFFFPSPTNNNETGCSADTRCQQPRTSDIKTGKVVINEIAWSGTEASVNDEWIELHNLENYSVDLSGWILKAEDGMPEIKIEDGKIIKANDYFLLERTDDSTVNTIPADQIYTGALNNEGEMLRLIDSSGIVVDIVGETDKPWPAGISIGKVSMEKTLDGWKNFGGDSFAKDINGNFIKGTPRASNSLLTSVVISSGGVFGGQNQEVTTTPMPTLSLLPSPTLSPLPKEKININTADLNKLQEIKGIGPVIAQRIIDYRAANGPFKKIEDIKNVKGIGDVKFEAMKNEITVGNVTTKPSAVINFVATHNSPTVTATWSAPDSGSYNLASLSYDLRYSTLNFPDDNSWSIATKVASSSLPNVGNKGASQSASFDVAYEYSQTLYFALKTKVIHTSTCDVSNMDKCSGISNIAQINFSSAINDKSWAMFGKDQYHTSLATTAGPGSTATISWEYDLGSGYSISQPVVSSDGDVFFGISNGPSNKLIKLDKNGLKQWEYITNVSIGTPAILSDESVYFGRIGAGGVLAFTALNPDGSKKWDYNDASTVNEITISSKKGEPHFTFTSGSVNKLLALKTDGSVKITKNDAGLSGFAPVILDDGTIIVAKKVSGNQLFSAYKPNGTEIDKIWNLAYTQTNGNTPVNPSYNKITGVTYSAAGSKIFSIPPDGSALNSTNIAPWDYAAVTSVAIGADTLYVGFDNINSASGSRLYALNKDSLSTKWTFQMDSYLNKQLVLDSNGNTYVSIQNGKLYSIDNTGTKRWSITTGVISKISPSLTEHGLIWSYGNKVVGINN